MTSLLDARRYPARQPAALYHERYEAEAVFAELKTHQRGARTVLSSKTPDGVLQQIWAHLLVHHALRELMGRTAATRGLDAERGPASHRGEHDGPQLRIGGHQPGRGRAESGDPAAERGHFALVEAVVLAGQLLS
ncbi:hypothetical protein [Streptomyces rishiriensis]|uniref:hypothetical protein n=1 Tax=Streptomyces rishiriensis TaxID=68264 RepID=UPI001FE75311|nr:hypothetical protein [Streptomyces rishiriensis]